MVKIKKQISRCAVVQQIRKSSRSENPADQKIQQIFCVITHLTKLQHHPTA